MPRLLNANTLRTHEDGLAYMVECTLATVSGLLLKKSPPKSELRRQISIAQAGITCLGASADFTGGLRLNEIHQKFENNVQAWADDYRARFLEQAQKNGR